MVNEHVDKGYGAISSRYEERTWHGLVRISDVLRHRSKYDLTFRGVLVWLRCRSRPLLERKRPSGLRKLSVLKIGKALE
jgi:hypothetical protein